MPKLLYDQPRSLDNVDNILLIILGFTTNLLLK